MTTATCICEQQQESIIRLALNIALLSFVVALIAIVINHTLQLFKPSGGGRIAALLISGAVASALVTTVVVTVKQRRAVATASKKKADAQRDEQEITVTVKH